MKSISNITLAIALASGAALAFVPAGAAMAQKQKKAKKDEAATQRVESPTKAYSESYNAVLKLLQAEDFAGAKSAFDSTAALATAPNDQYWAGNLALQIGAKSSDTALQRRALEMILDSGLASPEETAKYAFFSGQFAYQDKDYAKSVTRYQAAYDAGYRDNDIAILMAEAENGAGNIDGALTWLDKGVATNVAAGRAVPENWYKRGASIALNAKRPELASAWLNKLVLAYPTATNWRDTLAVYRDSVNLSTDENLDLLRLMRRAGALKSERDYGEYVESADARRLPGEVSSVLQEGRASGVLNGSNSYLNEQLLLADKTMAGDKAGLAGAARDARSAANGKVAAGTADAYFGYGDYAKASELYALALEKGGIDANQVNLRRGVALYETGDMVGAKAAFAAVTGGNRAQLAKYWALYVDSKANASAGAAG